MNVFTRRKEVLEQYVPPLTLEPGKADSFWEPVLQSAARLPLDVIRERQLSLFPTVVTDKLTYRGHDGTLIHAWFMIPSTSNGEKPPCIVTFPGYGYDRGLEERNAVWLLQGYAVLHVDARGQLGETGNRMQPESGSARGWASMGLLDKERSYYMSLALDVVGAIEAAARQPEIDASRIAAVGSSQGGGMALLAGALSDKVAAVVADIPNMCHLDYGVLHSTGSLTEIAQYLKRHPERLNAAMESLAHFDIMNLAHRFRAPVMMSANWKDMICWPEQIYAAYNRMTVPKQMHDYPFSGHEIGEEHQRKVFLYLKTCFNM